MISKQYSQNILDWDATEALAYTYGSTHMVLLVSPLCDASASLILSLILITFNGLSIYRLKKANQLSDYLKVIPRALVSVVTKGSGLFALAAVLKFLRVERFEPEGLWLELLETILYLVVMGATMIYSIQTCFISRYRDVVSTDQLVKTEKKLYFLYYAVVVRLMLRPFTVEDVMSGIFLLYSVFQTSYMWSFGFQAAKIE